MIKIIQGLLVAIMTGLSVLLCVEYISFRQQADRLAQLQEEYQTYTVAFRKILRDYQRVAEADDEASSDDDEKKKEQTFLVVNRDPRYLRESATRFLRKHRMNLAAERMYADEPSITTDHKSRSRTRTRITQRRVRQRRVHSSGQSLVRRQLSRHSALLRGKALVSDIHFDWPIDHSQFWLSSFYGPRRKPDRSWGFHHGLDLAAIKGTPVKSVAAGVVVESGQNTGYGNTIVVMHNKKYKTRYAHLHRIYARLGQHVETGQCIGTVGDTGSVRSKRGRSATHLHLETYVYGKRVNPLYFFI